LALIILAEKPPSVKEKMKSDSPLMKSTAGTAGSNAWGEVWIQTSTNQEALPVRAG